MMNNKRQEKLVRDFLGDVPEAQIKRWMAVFAENNLLDDIKGLVKERRQKMSKEKTKKKKEEKRKQREEERFLRLAEREEKKMERAEKREIKTVFALREKKGRMKVEGKFVFRIRDNIWMNKDGQVYYIDNPDITPRFIIEADDSRDVISKIYNEINATITKDSKGNRIYKLVYDRLTWKDTAQTEKGIQKNREYRFVAKSLKDAQKKAKYYVNLQAREENGEVFPWFVRGYEFKRLELDANQGIPIDPAKERMFKVSEITKYNLLNCSLNEKENENEADNCVIRYLVKRFKPYTTPRLNNKGNMSKPSLPKYLGCEKFLTRYFNKLEDMMKESIISDIFRSTDILARVEIDMNAPLQPVNGISPEMLNVFCQQYHISHTALNVMCGTVIKYVAEGSRSRPSLYYITNLKHLYPIENHEDLIKARERTKAVIKGKMKKKESKEEQKKEITDYVIVSDIVEGSKHNGTVFIEEQEDLNDYFLNLMISENEIPEKGSYRCDDDGNIISVYSRAEDNDYVHYICHKDVRKVVDCCKALNVPFYGQSLNEIAIGLISDSHKVGEFVKASVLNNQVYDAMLKTFRGGHNFCNKIKKNESVSLVGYDFKKQYTSILANDDNKFPIFSPFSEFERYKGGELENNYAYLVKSKNRFPLAGDGVYFGFILNRLDKSEYSITHYMKPSSYHFAFYEDVKMIYERLGEKLGKEVVNSFVGCLGRNKKKKVVKYFDNNIENAHYLYQKYCLGEEGMICRVEDSKFLEISYVNKKKLIETNLPMNMYIVQRGWEMTYLLREALGGKVSRVMVDTVIVNDGKELDSNTIKGVRVFPELCDAGSVYKLDDAECLKKTQKAINGKTNRDITLCENLPWKDLKVDEFDSEAIAKEILEREGCLLTGLAGTGKSHIVKAFKKLLEEEKIEYKVSAFTNSASKVVGGMTLHRLFCLSATDKIEKANTGNMKKGDWLIVDEISLVNSEFYNAFVKMREIGVMFLIVGDMNQLDPVFDKIDNSDKEKSYCLKQLVNRNRIVLNINKRSDGKMRAMYDNVLGDKFCVNDFQKVKYENIDFSDKSATHIAYRNRVVNGINREVYKTVSENFTKTKSVKVESKRIPAMRLWSGARVICWKACKKYDNIYNGEDMVVSEWDEDTITVMRTNENNVVIERKDFPYYFKLGYGITCHKAQGLTIDGKIFIHDWQFDRVDKKWLYTAISRTTDWKNLYFVL